MKRPFMCGLQFNNVTDDSLQAVGVPANSLLLADPVHVGNQAAERSGVVAVVDLHQDDKHLPGYLILPVSPRSIPLFSIHQWSLLQPV